MITIQ